MDEFDSALEELLEEAKKNRGPTLWWQRVLLRFWPRVGFRYFSRRAGIANDRLDKLHEMFSTSERIDFLPLSASRGFMIVIDGKLSLWFYQNGDHFKYDGFEMGEYDLGDVTIFDRLK